MLLPGVVLSRSVSWPSFLCSVTVYTVVDSGPFRVRPCACPAFRGATNSALSVSTVSSLLSFPPPHCVSLIRECSDRGYRSQSVLCVAFITWIVFAKQTS